MTPVSARIAPKSVAQPTHLIRGHNVTTDADLTDLYGLPTETLERKVSNHNRTLVCLNNVIPQLMQGPDGSPRPIGFTIDISKHRSK